MFASIITAIVMAVISYAITPKPKSSANRRKPQEIRTPTVDAGRPIPVIFGRVTIKDPNVLHFGGQHSKEVKG